MTKIPINVRRPLKYDSKQNVVRMTKIPVILTTFCLWSYFKGLLTFIGIFVILTTFCLDSYFKGLLKWLLKLSFFLHYIVIFLFPFAGDLNITFADSNRLLEEAKDSHVLSAALLLKQLHKETSGVFKSTNIDNEEVIFLNNITPFYRIHNLR
jgi:glucan phosphoethanolaminetransferase (alkaline phosphatase superfamily)